MSKTKSPPISQLPLASEYGLKSNEAINYWNRIGPQLISIGVLTLLHLDTFAQLCRTYAEYRRLDDWLNEDESRFTFMTQTGYESEAPQVRMRDKAMATLQKLWPKFGLSPLSLAQMRKHGGVALTKVSPLQAFAQKKYAEQNTAPKPTKPKAKLQPPPRTTKQSKARGMA
jgi:P27 family predicted phage terminase small subunit